jgi:hypothetical protein
LDDYERFLSSHSIIVTAHKKENLIIFDDTKPLEIQKNVIINGTVELKANFIRSAQLAGVLVHSIDMDDYTGQSCHRGAFPITSTVFRVFSKSIPSAPPTTTETPIIQKSPCSGVQTSSLVSDQNDCRYYYVCVANVDKPIAHLQCPDNMHFSPEQEACIKGQSVSFKLTCSKLAFH